MAKKDKKGNNVHQLEVITEQQVTTVDLPDEKAANQEDYEKLAAEGMVVGSIIAIIGQPKANADTTFDETLHVIKAAAENVYDNFTILHQPDVPMLSKEHMAKEYGGLAADPKASGYIADIERSLDLMQVGTALQSVGFESMSDLEDRAEKDRWDALTPEQQLAELNSRKAYREKQDAEWAERAEEERQKAVADAFAIAEKWAHKDDLRPSEISHGVAHDMFERYGALRSPVAGDGYTNPGQDYRNHYESQLKERIESRTQRAAQELFGK